MPRPNASNAINDTTYSGIRFQWILDGYEARGAPDSNVEVVHAMVAWDDASAFLRDIVGYSVWSPTKPSPQKLNRVLPIECPTRLGLRCDEYRLVDFGMLETRSDLADDEGLPSQDWCIYALTFLKNHWLYKTDTQLVSYADREQYRYVRRSRRYIPRERRQSGFAYEFQRADGTWVDVPDEARFTPDYELELTTEWRQIPVQAIPEQSIAALMLTVNDKLMGLGFGTEYEPGTLLFKGTQDSGEVYIGADGGSYENIKYVFGCRPNGGWLKYLLPDLKAGRRQYGLIRRKGSGDPLYPSGNHQLLFTPADNSGVGI